MKGLQNPKMMNHSCPSDLNTDPKERPTFALVHVSSTKDGVRANNATNTIVVWHRYVAFVYACELYVDCLAWCPSLVYVLEGKTSSVFNIADHIRDKEIAGVDLVHSDFNPITLTLSPAERLSAGDGL